jgi:two-component sensor histidine kinase
VAALEDTRNRVRSMALLHETRYRSRNLALIDFSMYLKDLCGHLEVEASKGTGAAFHIAFSIPKDY